ncbi:MAG TPA: efflux transporter outer membrane subunit [Nevskiaceae bacterium]|nr:efflux transporter outer membrane subunit [Nevskiaceae bacterium]
MSVRLRGLLLGVTATLSACALGPDYARPAIDTPDRFRWEPAGEAPGSVADLKWWDVYQDPALRTLIETALKQNLDVRIAAARVEQARALGGAATLGLLPQVAATGSSGRIQQSRDVIAGAAQRTIDRDSAGLSLSWELDLWGRLRRLDEAARADLLGAEAARQGVMVGLVSDVATTWFQLAFFDEQLRITRGTVETRQQFLGLTRAQFERGVVSGLDVSTAEAQLSTAQASIPEFERQVALAEHQLSLLLGGNPTGVPNATPAVPPSPDLPVGLPSQLLERRPDVRQAQAALVAANARVGAAKAALFPTISLTGTFGTASDALHGLFAGPAETWSAGVGLVQPLLDAERSLYQVDLADARKAEALLAYEKTVRNAFREVSDALVARQKFQETERARAALVEALSRSEEIATARYKVGYSSYFDVINADRDLFEAKLALSSARLSSLLATVELYRALGGGWEVAPAGGSPGGAG